MDITKISEFLSWPWYFCVCAKVSRLFGIHDTILSGLGGVFILLVECSNLKKYFADRLIIQLENFKVYSEDRIGIVGANGVGKTTLLKILSKGLEPDEGQVKLYGKCAYISQLDPPEQKQTSAELAAQFGISSTWNETMSGGETTRFKLAQSLSQDCPLIFADEPTSNLDLEGIELLERRLAEHRSGLILISHDRRFLNQLCNKILEIEEGELKVYPGNYSDYCVQKQEERERRQFEYQQYIKEKKRLLGAVEETKQKVKNVRKTPKRMGNSEARLHKMGDQKAKASLDRAIKSTETRIEHLEVKEKPAEQQRIKLDVTDSGMLYSKIIIEGNDICKTFGKEAIFRDAEFKIENGAKVALIGPNGCGKSTLLKMILAKDDSLKVAQGAKIGYFSQDMTILKDKLSIIENVMEESIYQESFVRTLLARLLLKGDAVYKQVGLLSGGERVKVSFAKILLQDINLLILDEPTNYLDINSLEVIEEALRGYNRTLLFVSHDRSLIGSVADHIMTIENQGIQMFQGSYADYLAQKDRSSDDGREDLEKQVLILQHRLTEVVGRLSIPRKKDDMQALDKEYHELLAKLKPLREKLKGLTGLS
ncbi:ATPase component of ABC transporters with duplicated ATPase domain [Desulfosporosinus orientis DSM 765]|uniref:ATPase component of ABC transporters with duplicated ATPase domain n=1 Tax=Desulfosporosinus orientis (strain ATCC 19365 / DSM 765 / NCIMB 8382 / VKM B-1628 / Singapore I) TaxID=768706 RepID=G7WH05_DESOD|nr:ATPase component of ABC transporters with duplicated ATPase domain [Desulfosporosinus orientis DSM 765]